MFSVESFYGHVINFICIVYSSWVELRLILKVRFVASPLRKKEVSVYVAKEKCKDGCVHRCNLQVGPVKKLSFKSILYGTRNALVNPAVLIWR